MFLNYLKIAIRILRKEKLYTVINILGLTVGLTGAIFIFLYVTDEFRYDLHLSKAGTMYRVSQVPFEVGGGERNAGTPFPLYETMTSTYGHVFENVTRFYNHKARRLALYYEPEQKKFNETRLFFVDHGAIELFDVTLIKGNPKVVLNRPNSIILSESSAKRMFGDTDPLGKVLKFEGRIELTVTGIFQDIPAQSHFIFDQLASMESLERFFGGSLPSNWYWNPCWTYYNLKPDVTVDEANLVLASIARDRLPEPSNQHITFSSQPVIDIRLNSDLESEIQPVNDITYIRIFLTIAIMLLAIACINFINLTSARASKRLKEVSLRKIFGARRSELVFRFMGESLLMTLFSAVVSLMLVFALLPQFNQIAEKSFYFSHLFEPDFLLIFLAAITFLTVASGVYPALILSRWSPLELIRSSGGSIRKSYLRYALVVSQFVIAILLISGTLMVNKQLRFIQEADLGFDTDQVLVLPVSLGRLVYRYDTFRERVINHPLIKQVAGTSSILGNEYGLIEYTFEGAGTEPAYYPMLFASDGFTELFDIELVSGRPFLSDSPSDVSSSVLVNESFVRAAGWGSPDNAIGKWIKRDAWDFTVVGVMRDFNSTSLHKAVEPLIIEMPKIFFIQVEYISIKVADGRINEVLPFLEEEYRREDPTRIFEYFYLDEELQKQYASESKMQYIISIFSFICILVSCLGLFGLASYTTEMKTKSIGIRKVLGATESGIVFMLSREYTTILLIANALAIPVSWWLVNEWLQGFAYRTEPDFIIYGTTFILTVITAFISVSYHTYRLAVTDPVKTLHYE